MESKENPEKLFERAEQLSKSKNGLIQFFFKNLRSLDLDDASNLYVQAANIYRVKKDFIKAAECFDKSAKLQEELQNYNEVANRYVDIFKCFKENSPREAINALEKAVEIFLMENGQFRRAANFTMDIAEMYENLCDYENAIKSYQNAGDYYSTDNATALANKSYSKCADLCALHDRFEEGLKHYDFIIKGQQGNSLAQWNLKENLFKSILCVLCMNDRVETQKRIENIPDDNNIWGSSRELILLKFILTCFDQFDSQTYSDQVFEFDQFCKLDNVKTHMLVKIKKNFQDVDEDDLL